MRKSWFLVISLALVLTMVFLSGCTTTTTPSLGGIFSTQQEGIWVTGTGKVTVVPDIATMRLGIEAQEASVAEAQSKATEAMNQVLVALDKNGVAEKDIQTQYFSIQQVTRWDNIKQEEVAIGYRVNNMVIAKIRDVDKAGEIIDSVAEAGGDLTRINSIAFSVDDPSAYHEEAREKAMADAKDKAKQLANLAGVTLGKPTYISESIQAPPPIYPRAVYEEVPMPAPAAPPISPGEEAMAIYVETDDGPLAKRIRQGDRPTELAD